MHGKEEEHNSNNKTIKEQPKKDNASCLSTWKLLFVADLWMQLPNTSDMSQFL